MGLFGAAITSTLAPSRSRSAPSVTTFSPSARSPCTLTQSPSVVPSRTPRIITLLSALTTYTNAPRGARCTAVDGTATASTSVLTCSLILTN